MLCNANTPKDFLQRSILVLWWSPHYSYGSFPKIFVLACNLEFLSLQNPPIFGTILKNKTLAAQVTYFLRVKTPAAYVRVRCYPPARVSNFLKGFFSRVISLYAQRVLARFWFLFSGWCGNAMV